MSEDEPEISETLDDNLTQTPNESQIVPRDGKQEESSGVVEETPYNIEEEMEEFEVSNEEEEAEPCNCVSCKIIITPDDVSF